LKTEVLAAPAELLAALQDLVAWAHDIKMAFAWAHSSNGKGPHWKALDLSKVRRAVIGTEFARTEPYALSKLNAMPGRLKVMINETGTFHPKVIIGFRGKSARVIVGSANFTSGAYSTNAELCIQLSEQKDDPSIGALEKYIDDQWEKASAVDASWISKYEVAFERAKRQPIVPIPGSALDLATLERLDMSWSDFAARINGQEGRKAGPDFHISVRGESPSYFEELDAAQQLFNRQIPFAQLAAPERMQLLGVGKRSTGLLGSMRLAGNAKGLVSKDPQAIGLVLDALPLTGDVSLVQAEALLRELTSLRGVGLGVATRLFAVKRPDLFVSVNRGSSPQLMALLDGKVIRTVGNYVELLRRVWNTAWHRSDRPTKAADAALWDRRAALLDAALYRVV